MSSKLQTVYKCIEPILPIAVTGVFEQNQQGELRFRGHVQDDPRPTMESGHVRPYTGDSGSPYWIPPPDTFDMSTLTNYKAILVAIHSSKVGFPKAEIPPYSESEKGQCSIKATKLTGDIIQWAKEKSGISK